MTKAKLLAAIKKCARKLRRTPTVAEIKRMTGITDYEIRKHFANVTQALYQAGIDVRGVGRPANTLAVLEDWGRVTRKLGRPPSYMDYRREGQYTNNSLLLRCGAWSRVGERFQAEITQRKSENDWLDVLAIIKEWQGSTTAEGRRKMYVRASERVVHDEPQPGRKFISGRRIYGPPSKIPGLRNEPTNEAGVTYVFGRIADKLGFEVERIQTAFPDCEALREVAKDKWQRVRIEVEYTSRNFLDHGHPVKGCDVIVCWIHNWLECPKHLEVIELKRLVRGM
jgi:Homing endonuclease associated repeat